MAPAHRLVRLRYDRHINKDIGSGLQHYTLLAFSSETYYALLVSWNSANMSLPLWHWYAAEYDLHTSSCCLPVRNVIPGRNRSIGTMQCHVPRHVSIKLTFAAATIGLHSTISTTPTLFSLQHQSYDSRCIPSLSLLFSQLLLSLVPRKLVWSPGPRL